MREGNKSLHALAKSPRISALNLFSIIGSITLKIYSDIGISVEICLVVYLHAFFLGVLKLFCVMLIWVLANLLQGDVFFTYSRALVLRNSSKEPDPEKPTHHRDMVNLL